MNIRLLSLWLLLILAPGACAPYSRIRENTPAPAAVPGLSATGARNWKAVEKQPLASMGACLGGADAAAQRLRTHPRDAGALQDYNAALNGFFTVLKSSNLRIWDQPVRLPAPGGDYTVTVRADAKHPERHPRLYEYYPSANLKIDGVYIKERTIKDGLGAALVAVRREARPDARERFSLDRAYYGVTAVARFTGRNCEIEFADPLAAEAVSLNGRSWVMAADFTAPLALLLHDSDARRREIWDLIRPPDPADTARLVRLQGFDPEKTTVIVVHGLASSSATWVPMLNALRGDPDVRKRYQFWFFDYPSGCPFPYTAAIFRRELEAAVKVFPQRKPMILVGHSMGGLISRLTVTDSGDVIWKNLLPADPARLRVSAQERAILQESLIFSARQDVGRAVFIATPHRGSDLASGWLGRVANRIIRLPQTLVSSTLTALVPGDGNGKLSGHIPNSVDTLSSKSPFVKTAARLPMRRGLTYHSIIGDRGRGDTPNSSDGIVPYWSSHLKGAQSEVIVPSGHSAHQNPEAIAEVLRILHRHR